MKAAVSIVVAFICISSLHYSKADPAWNDLRGNILMLYKVFNGPKAASFSVTFGINPLSTWDFDEMPRDLHGNMKSFTLKDDQCKNGGNLPFHS